MQLNYSRLGDYIELVRDRNSDLYYGETDVRGVSNKKEIMQTKANNKQRAFDNFYVVAPNDFIYNSRTSRMGDKVGLGFNDSGETFITSFNNTVFRIKSESLSPMYLFMWFNRPEFDRYARYHSWGSSTELFPWDEMLDVELPIPHIDIQRAIVKEYNTVVDRISLNQKLEETAQALYKHWFVDFEFPNEEGKPYKSSGGAMEFNEELEKEIPEGWEVDSLSKNTSLIKRGISPKYSQEKGVVVINQKCIRNNTVNLSFSRLHDFSQKSIPKEKMIQKLDILVNSTGTGTLGRVGVVKNLQFPLTVDSHVTIVRSSETLSKYYLASFLANNENIIVELGEGSTGQTELSRNNLGDMNLIIPSTKAQGCFDQKVEKLLNHSLSIESFSPKLIEMKVLILSKMTKTEKPRTEQVNL